MSALLATAMIVSIETHKGKYVPPVGDSRPSYGIHIYANTTAPSGTVKVNQSVKMPARFTYNINNKAYFQLECTVVKEICLTDDQCEFQRVFYIIDPGSQIGEQNSTLSHRFTYPLPGTYWAISTIYFNECMGMSYKNVVNTGVIQAK